MTTEPVPLEDLLQHADWVRTLARTLVRDAARADDVVQEVWLAAVRRPPPSGESPRGWLRTVARRLAGLGARRDVAERRRGEMSARPEALPSTADLAERASLQRDVSARVLSLDEPYRRVILLRYWEGLPPRRIAELDGVPVSTVKTRLQRAQAKLREDLEDEYGDEGRWCIALAPLVADGVPLGVPGPLGPGRVLAAASRGALVVTGLAAATWGVKGWSDAWGDAGVNRLPEIAGGVLRGPLAGDDLAPPSRALARGELARKPRAAATESSGPSPPTVRLVDMAGRPLAGLRLRRTTMRTVRWRSGDPVWIGNDRTSLRISLEEQARLAADSSALEELCVAQSDPREWAAALLGRAIPERETTSGEAGVFETPNAFELEVVEPGWTLLGVGPAREGGGTMLVAARAVELAGRVLDPAGEPLAGARVTWSAESKLLTENLARSPRECRTDSKGRFVLRDAPVGARFSVSAHAHATWSSSVPATAERQLVVRLRRRAPGTLRVEGVVVDGAGRPLSEANVQLGAVRTAVAEDGTFELGVDEAPPDAALLVWARGRAPWIEPEAGAALAACQDGRLVRRIVLDGEPGTLFGRVLDERGRPVADAEVGLLEPTVLPGSLASLEARVDGRDLTVLTDAAGAFRLGGLVDPEVRLRIFDRAGRRMYVTPGLPIGPVAADVVLPAAARGRRVTGRIELPSPAGPAKLSLLVGWDWLRGAEGSRMEAGQRVEADEDGRFTLEHVPASDAWIQVLWTEESRRFPVEALDAPGAHDGCVLRWDSLP